MIDGAVEVPTLSEIAVVAGTPRSVARAAQAQGVLGEHELSWLDALVLRVYFTVSSVRFPGEMGRRTRDVAVARASAASLAVRREVDAERMLAGVQLVVTREGVEVAESIGHLVVYLDRDLAGLESAQVLPVGRWWYEMRWRGAAPVPPRL